MKQRNLKVSGMTAKRHKFGRLSVIVALVAFVAPFLFAAPALALPEITLSPTSGAIGTQVIVSGSGFQSFAGTDIKIFFDNEEIIASPLTVPESGTFTASFEVTDGTEPGTAYVKITTVIGGEVRKSFIVEEPEIELDTEEGAVGAMVTIEGRGFYAGGTMDVYYYLNGSRVNVGSEVTSPTGDFTYTFPIPDSVAGEHRIKVEDALDSSAEAYFEVVPYIVVSRPSGAIGDELIVSGTGFSGGGDVSLYFNNIMMTEEAVDKYGSFDSSFKVPTLQSGIYGVEAEDGDDNRAEVAFTVMAGAGLNPAIGFVGTAVNVSGVGFKTGSMVAVTYDEHEVITAVPGDNGSFSAAFKVPPSSAGHHTVTITDGTNTVTAIFTMEAEAPLAPELVSPEEDERAEAAPEFDWEDVSDDSGVSYTIQVATKDTFAASYIVLEQADLTDSEYDVAEDEELEPSSKESPHYWRVKAVDGADNEGEWSEVGSFYVGSSFTLPETAKKVLIGVGIVGAVFFGFWLGRKTAYARRV